MKTTDDTDYRDGERLRDIRRLNAGDKKKLREEREKLCGESLERVHALYKFHCIDGKVRSLKEICDIYNRRKLPPTGTGDCCAPKLLDYAFAQDLTPISLAETRYNFQFSPFNFHLASPCDERCGILLPAMLGLRILWRDEAICVVNKQSGVLSVPGRGEDKQDCIESRFKRLFGSAVEIAQPAVHRLDMETSGVMILAFTRAAHRELNRQFEAKEVEKEYVALLDGVLAKKGIAPHGEMELFFRLDVENRPKSHDFYPNNTLHQNLKSTRLRQSSCAILLIRFFLIFLIIFIRIFGFFIIFFTLFFLIFFLIFLIFMNRNLIFFRFFICNFLKFMIRYKRG